MMQRNESLLQAVTKALRAIENQLKQQHIDCYAAEWVYLAALLQSAHQSALAGEGVDKKALVKAMMTISGKIDAEMIRLEAELQGVQNYASMSAHKLADITFKQELKSELRRLIGLIARAPIKAKHADLSDIIDMLKPEKA
jgi:hypothetical protein